ncbi:hypothetical protein CVT24_011988, partial [Panaeolus cyanescens]
WYGRRAGLDVNRGPFLTPEEALVAPAQKEIAYLKQFGKPLLPLRRERRPSYNYQEQSPLDHLKNLERYLAIAPSILPKDPALSHFYMRHPDLHPNNIFVSLSPSSDCKIVSVFDWQHTSILPMFLLAGIPERLQNYADNVSQSMMLPSRPENLEEMDEARRDSEEYRYRCRLVHYHYVTSTMKHNPLHYAAFMDPLYALRGQLFLYAGAPWEGESSELKLALIQTKNRWDELSGGVVPCPLEFDAQDLAETAALEKDMNQVIRGFELLQAHGGVGVDGWVPAEDYESTMAFFKDVKEKALATAESEEECEEINDHWPWDDMDEEAYM